jgi:GNAT superfamily N-acetyltransferase
VSGRRIAAAGPADVDALVALLGDYCAFYKVDPGAEALRALVLALLEDPAQGVQLVARDEGGEALGFATVYWTWSTTRAGRVGVMNDLFVVPAARGSGLGAELIAACADRAREAGVLHLEWRTAPDNATAQRLYDRLAPGPRDWRHYRLGL